MATDPSLRSELALERSEGVTWGTVQTVTYDSSKLNHALSKYASIGAMMQIDKFIRQQNVGADLSRPQPIDRPSLDLPLFRMIVLNFIIAPTADLSALTGINRSLGERQEVG